MFFYMPEMHYDKETWIMVNQMGNLFYTRFLFKIDALLQEVGSLLDIATNCFNNLIPDVREFVQAPGRLPT